MVAALVVGASLALAHTHSHAALNMLSEFLLPGGFENVVGEALAGWRAFERFRLYYIGIAFVIDYMEIDVSVADHAAGYLEVQVSHSLQHPLDFHIHSRPHDEAAVVLRTTESEQERVSQITYSVLLPVSLDRIDRKFRGQ